jgi:hypothetical protein
LNDILIVPWTVENAQIEHNRAEEERVEAEEERLEAEEAMNTFMKMEVEGEQRDNQESEIDLEPGELLDAAEDGWGQIDQDVDHEPGEMMEVAEMEVDEVEQQTGSMDQDQDIPNPDRQVEGEASNRQAGQVKDVQMTTLAKVIIRSPTGQLTDHGSGAREVQMEEGDEDNSDDDDDDDDGTDGSSSVRSKRKRKNIRISNSCYRKRKRPVPPSHSGNTMVTSSDNTGFIQTVCHLYAAILYYFTLSFSRIVQGAIYAAKILYVVPMNNVRWHSAPQNMEGLAVYTSW